MNCCNNGLIFKFLKHIQSSHYVFRCDCLEGQRRKETKYPRWIDVKQGLYQNEMPSKEQVDKLQVFRWFKEGWKNYENQLRRMKDEYGDTFDAWKQEWKEKK